MAYRALIAKVLNNSNLRPLLVLKNPMLLRAQPKSDIMPKNAFLSKPSMFSPTVIKKYYELIPLAVIMGGAILGLIFAIVRNSMTRDDVRFSTSGKMLCEQTELNSPRKLLVFHQKYETPKGLAEALAALEEPSEVKKAK